MNQGNLSHQFKKLTPQQKAAKREDVLDRHAELAPMKNTLKDKGVSFSAVSGHLRTNGKVIFGTHMTKKDSLAWAVKKHREDPDNFLKNIGFNQ